MLLDGVMLLWFILTALAVIFVAFDIRSTPESPVMKWAFVLVTAYTGPIGAFLYVLGCREPLPGTHEAYTSARWRQVLGSTMHCVAGDGVGILAGAVLASHLALPRPADFALEYVLGFGFGWTIFQALFMRDMAGGSYVKSLRMTFLSEFLSMNVLMTAMLPVSTFGMLAIGGAMSPSTPAFWFVMSMALLAGLIAAYPMNWWLVANGLKHGMTTIRPGAPAPAMAAMRSAPPVSRGALAAMTLLSICLLAAGAGIALRFDATSSATRSAQISVLASYGPGPLSFDASNARGSSSTHGES